jgi:4-aminobutyrate aminotransferase/(S)-3-amino-2-methylpropionate transaminase
MGGTYGGNPVACAAALAVLDVIADEKLAERAQATGDIIKARLQAIAARNDVLPMGAIRGRGAMVAFELFTDRNSFLPDAEKTRQVTARAMEEGLVLLSCGNFANTIRILAPLTIPDDILGEGLDMLQRALVA